MPEAWPSSLYQDDIRQAELNAPREFRFDISHTVSPIHNPTLPLCSMRGALTCISSNIKTAPASLQRFLRAFNHHVNAELTPPSPCRGSTITAHVSPVTSLSISSIESTLPTSTSGMSGTKGFWYFALLVTLSAPILRPWNECSKQRILVLVHSFESHARPGTTAAHLSLPIFRAIFSAPSFASVPELAKKTFAPIMLFVGSSCRPDGQPSPPSVWVSVTSNCASLPAHS